MYEVEAEDVRKQAEAAAKAAEINKRGAEEVGRVTENIFTSLHAKDPGKAFQDQVMKGIGQIFVKQGEAMLASSGIFTSLGALMTNPFTAGPVSRSKARR